MSLFLYHRVNNQLIPLKIFRGVHTVPHLGEFVNFSIDEIAHCFQVIEVHHRLLESGAQNWVLVVQEVDYEKQFHPVLDDGN